MTDERMKLIFDLAQSSQNVDEFTKKIRESKGAVEDMAAAGSRLDDLSHATDAATSKMAGFGQSALQTGRVVQDFTQGGIAGILNNIEGLSMALGGGAGLAGVMTLVGVAAFVAMPKLKEFWAALTGGESGGAAAIRQALDATEERLHSMKDHAEDIAKAFERMAKAPTRAGAKGAKGLEQVITEAPAEEIQTDITRAIAGTEFGAKIPENLRKRIESVQQFIDQAATPEGREQAEKEMEPLRLQARRAMIAENRRRAAELMAGAVQPGAAGEGARQRIAELVKQSPDQFPQGFASDIAAASPEAVKRQERFEQDLEARKQAQERIRRDTAAKNRELEERAKDEARGPALAEKEARQRREVDEHDMEMAVDMKRRDAERQAREKAAADAALTSEVMAAAAPIETPRERQMGQARRGVSQMSQQMGYGMPSPQQADEMATQALQYMSNGMQADQAMWMSVSKKVEAISAAARQFYEMRQRQQQNGFSAMDR